MSEITRERIAEVLDSHVGPMRAKLILDELFPAEPGPRTWSIPAEPEDVERVRDADGGMWKCDAGEWRHDDLWRTWGELLNEYGPLTEVVESEVEAAARRLRENEFADKGHVMFSTVYARHAEDIRTVLVHVLNGGTL